MSDLFIHENDLKEKTVLFFVILLLLIVLVFFIMSIYYTFFSTPRKSALSSVSGTPVSFKLYLADEDNWDLCDIVEADAEIKKLSQ